MTTGYTDDHAAAGTKAALPELETWPSQYGDDYEVAITIPEFTSICPKTGLPDFATLVVTYVPDAHCVELKSFKEYLLAYRNLGIFNENVVNRVLADLVAATRPAADVRAGRLHAARRDPDDRRSALADASGSLTGPLPEPRFVSGSGGSFPRETVLSGAIPDRPREGKTGRGRGSTGRGRS